MTDEIKCPFCGDDDMDKVGLKFHLFGCDEFITTDTIPRMFCVSKPEPEPQCGWEVIKRHVNAEGDVYWIDVRSEFLELAGYVKWDGCTELRAIDNKRAGLDHICDLAAHASAMLELHSLAKQEMAIYG
jgi:hypothetical protein